MGKIVHLENGHLVYEGILSSKEKASIDDILESLREELPLIEGELLAEYGQSVWYKYNLGIFLGELLEKYEISISEQRAFWDELKDLVTKEKRTRNEGAKAVTRSFYHQCYTLSLQDRDVVEKLTWRQWQDILDRVGNRTDSRIFTWIKNYPEKIREDDWREFEKALNLYLKEKDTSVFSDKELFEIYDSIMMMSIKWRLLLKEYKNNHPKSAKLKSKGAWAKKYYAACFAKKKELRIATVTEEICEKEFVNLMEY